MKLFVRVLKDSGFHDIMLTAQEALGRLEKKVVMTSAKKNYSLLYVEFVYRKRVNEIQLLEYMNKQISPKCERYTLRLEHVTLIRRERTLQRRFVAGTETIRNQGSRARMMQ